MINASSLCIGKTKSYPGENTEDLINSGNDEYNTFTPRQPYPATNPFPLDNSTSVPPSPTCSVEIHDPPHPDGSNVQVWFWSVDKNINEEDRKPFAGGMIVTEGGRVSATWHDAKKPGSVHYWEVLVTDTTWMLPARSYTWRFKINLPPDKPKNPCPENNERYINTSPKLSVDVSDPDDNNMSVTFFDASNHKEIGVVNNVESGSTASITWSDLDYGTTYRWYAIADDGIFDNRSETFSFTTNYLPVFSNLNPQDGSDDVSFYLDGLSVNISDPDGDSFSWSITTFPDIGKNKGNRELNGTKTCSLRGLKPLTKYTLNIEATDMRGATIKTSYQFTTKQNIAPVVNVLSPRDDSFNVSIANCILNWSCVDSDGEDNKMVYDVYFGKSRNPDRVAKDITDTCFIISNDLDLDTTYYWKIKATDNFGKSTESNIWSFSTSKLFPPPAVGSIDINFPKWICWAGVKADITNNGIRNASNVFWHVTVNGGIFGRINVTKRGYIDILSLNETERISTYEFLNFKTMPFGFGRASITVIVTDENSVPVGRNSVDVIIFSRLMIVLRGGLR